MPFLWILRCKRKRDVEGADRGAPDDVFGAKRPHANGNGPATRAPSTATGKANGDGGGDGGALNTKETRAMRRERLREERMRTPKKPSRFTQGILRRRGRAPAQGRTLTPVTEDEAEGVSTPQVKGKGSAAGVPPIALSDSGSKRVLDPRRGGAGASPGLSCADSDDGEFFDASDQLSVRSDESVAGDDETLYAHSLPPNFAPSREGGADHGVSISFRYKTPRLATESEADDVESLPGKFRASLSDDGLGTGDGFDDELGPARARARVESLSAFGFHSEPRQYPSRAETSVFRQSSGASTSSSAALRRSKSSPSKSAPNAIGKLESADVADKIKEWFETQALDMERVLSRSLTKVRTKLVQAQSLRRRRRKATVVTFTSGIPNISTPHDSMLEKELTSIEAELDPTKEPEIIHQFDAYVLKAVAKECGVSALSYEQLPDYFRVLPESGARDVTLNRQGSRKDNGKVSAAEGVAKLRDMFPESLHFHTDLDLLRFLKARDHVFDDAAKMYAEYCSRYRSEGFTCPYPFVRDVWGSEWQGLDVTSAEGPQGPRAPFRDPALTRKLKDFYDCYLQNVVFEEDVRGAPVVYTRIAPPVDRGMEHVDLDLRINFQSVMFEQLRLVLLRATITQKRPVTSALVIMDAQGAQVSKFIAYARTPGAKAEAQFTGDFFPELMYKLVVLNAPLGAGMVWRIVSVFLPKATREKIKIFSAGEKKQAFKAMQELVHRSKLPKMFGGDAKFDFPKLKDIPASQAAKP
mmetsp:Transcript_12344/g.45014  ORF Transcript_12344/g.45014 Transcript_12344/m.45014 type:complete len:754 (+) Transcript_12344:115-2376(+)